MEDKCMFCNIKDKEGNVRCDLCEIGAYNRQTSVQKIDGSEQKELFADDGPEDAKQTMDASAPIPNSPTTTVQKNTTHRIVNAVGWVAVFIGLFLILNNLPIFSTKGFDPNAGLAIIFVTGLLTSLHCIGMCSGFVISYASNSKGITPHFCYNGSRLFSYVILGALLGLIGSIFTFSDQLRSYLAIGAGIFMILYGASMFFPQLRRFVSIPGLDVEKHAKKNPVLFGLLNGFMPCGPLQAMLIYAAGTGNPIEGGLVMLAFGLGTIPLMFLMGATISIASAKWTHKIFKFAGVLVLVLGVIMLGRGLLLNGIALPFLSTATITPEGGQAQLAQSETNTFQEINMTVSRYGWEPSSFVVKKGIPVRWNIYVKEITGCNQGIKAPNLGINYMFQNEGEIKTFEFTPTRTGTIYFTCWMGMIPGQIEVR